MKRLIIEIGIAVIIYMLPTIIAAFRKYKNMKPIVVINIMFGWTVIAWFALIGLALFHDSYQSFRDKYKAK